MVMISHSKRGGVGSIPHHHHKLNGGGSRWSATAIVRTLRRWMNKVQIYFRYRLRHECQDNSVPPWSVVCMVLAAIFAIVSSIVLWVMVLLAYNLIYPMYLVDLAQWWNAHPNAPIGLSCVARMPIDEPSPTIVRSIGGLEVPSPLFQARDPMVLSTDERIQVAYVVAFVEFQLPKLIYLMERLWSVHPPCEKGAEQVSADLIFYTPIPLSDTSVQRISFSFAQLGKDRTGCFHSPQPIFLNLPDSLQDFPRLEGAALSFYSLFPSLETQYKTFLLAEPDAAPIRPYFIPAMVETSKRVHCGDENGGVWQLGSIPLYENSWYGLSFSRVDYHINGNSLYALGCPRFEDFKCRVQTYFIPRNECSHVAGCATYRLMEGGYDHAMYQFRLAPRNYDYARLVMDKFAYGYFLANRGEDTYDAAIVAESSPSTYLVHAKTIFTHPASRQLNQVTEKVVGMSLCGMRLSMNFHLYGVTKRLYQYLRTGEYDSQEALAHFCATAKSSFLVTPNAEACQQFKTVAGGTVPTLWKDRMPGKTYLWTMDFHGGPINCDIPIITEAGGAVHAEIDGICEFYGLCKDRLKVIRRNNWKEFDPTDRQITQFTQAYQNDPEFQRVDAFLCHHPVANCELFLPFNRSIIVHATTRLEFGRHDAGIDWRLESGYTPAVGQKKWKRWIHTLQKLATDKRNVIAANNVYDRDYIQYFTGIENVQLLPSWCAENVGRSFCQEGWDSVLAPQWEPSRPEVMIVPYRGNLDRSRFKKNIRRPEKHPIIKELRAVSSAVSNGTSVNLIQEIYSDANPLNMLAHPAIIIIPYQISTINLLELYRLNIPSFCPSLKLLKKWCREHDLMWETHYGWPENVVADTRHQDGVPDPNGRFDMDKSSPEWEAMFDHWMPKADFYQFDHITYFDSWEDFFRKYHAMAREQKLVEISLAMERTNTQLRQQLIGQWKTVLQRVKQT